MPSGQNDERVRVRMGLHTGAAIAEEGDFFGRSVILAARIAAQAGAGEVLASEETIAAARARVPASEARTLALRGITTPVVVRAIPWP